LLTLKQQLNATKATLDLTDARDNAHRIKNVGGGLFGVVALRDGENETVALQGGLDRSQGRWSAGRNWLGQAWKNYRSPQGKNG